MKETITQYYPFTDRMPREVCFPYRNRCTTVTEFFDLFNRVNGIKHKIYVSVYALDENDTFENSIIDKIPLDMDSDNALENLRKVYGFCEKYNYKCMFTFSTGGFWAFIYTTGVLLKNPKIALGDAQRFIAKELGFTIARGKNGDLDESIIGDIARITRAVNSYDLGRKRFCIVLRDTELLTNTYDEIVEIAQKPRFEYYTYGDEGFDLSKFDSDKPVYTEREQKVVPSEMAIPVLPADLDGTNLDAVFDSLLPCVKEWLTVREMGSWKNRYWFAVYCSQMAIPPNICDALARKYFGAMPRTDHFHNNYQHFKSLSCIKRAYTQDKTFPNCNTLIECRACRQKCVKYRGMDSPVYSN